MSSTNHLLHTIDLLEEYTGEIALTRSGLSEKEFEELYLSNIAFRKNLQQDVQEIMAISTSLYKLLEDKTT